MKQKQKTIGLLLICLLTVGIASVYAAGSNPFEALDAQFADLISDFGDMWNRINGLESNLAALEARIDVLEGPPSIEPTYTIRVGFSTERSYIDISEGDSFYVYNYLNNPSLTIEYDPENSGGEGPLDSADVQYITMNITLPDGGTEWWRYYPNGDFEFYEYPGERWPLPGYELRWHSKVHPGETSLVFYSGWGFWSDDPIPPGIYQYSYELRVEYSGTTYNLVNTFEIDVRE